MNQEGKKIKSKHINVIKITTPPIASSGTGLALVRLTEHLVKTKRADWVGGVLGGEFGYGCHFRNKVFEMRPFYWGECDCGCSEDEEHSSKCSLQLPNFKHYKSDLEIRWYKWIGRDMEFSKHFTDKQWRGIFKECIDSFKN